MCSDCVIWCACAPSRTAGQQHILLLHLTAVKIKAATI